MASDFTPPKHLLAILVAALAVFAVMCSHVDGALAHGVGKHARQGIASGVALGKSVRVPAERSKPPASGGHKVYLGATVGGSVYGESSNPPWNMKPLETFEA